MPYTDKWLRRVVIHETEAGVALREGMTQDTYPLPVAEGEYWMDVDVKLTVAEVRKLRAARSSSKPEDMKFVNEFLAKQVSAWNLDGEDGVLPVSKESIDLVDQADVTLAMGVITAGRKGTRTPAEQTDFLSD